MKKTFEVPTINITAFISENVITLSDFHTSTGSSGSIGGGSAGSQITDDLSKSIWKDVDNLQVVNFTW